MFASRLLVIAVALLLGVGSAKAGAEQTGIAIPRFSPSYLFDPTRIAWRKETGDPWTDAANKVNAFCQGKCAATFFVGREVTTAMTDMFGIHNFVSPTDYSYGNSYLVGGALSRVIGEVGNVAALEVEIGVGQRFGTLHETEGWIALYGRWKYFPWNNYLLTTVAVSTGLNYATGIPLQEYIDSGNGQGSNVLHYFSPEITFALPSKPDTELVIRAHHRSGGGQFFGSHFPIYGSMFHGIEGGMQYIVVGLRKHF
jgi:hypothetical protein